MNSIEEELRDEIKSLKERNGYLSDDNRDLNETIEKMSNAAYDIFQMK